MLIYSVIQEHIERGFIKRKPTGFTLHSKIQTSKIIETGIFYYQKESFTETYDACSCFMKILYECIYITAVKTMFIFLFLFY